MSAEVGLEMETVKRAEEEIRIRKGDHAPFFLSTDTCPQFQLLREGIQKLGIRIPVSTLIFNLGEKKLRESRRDKIFRSRQRSSKAWE